MGLLPAVAKRAGKLEPGDLDELLAKLGGKRDGGGKGDGELVTLRFPVGGPRKAHAASRSLSTALALDGQP